MSQVFRVSAYSRTRRHAVVDLQGQTSRGRHGPALPAAWTLKGVTEGALPQHGFHQDLKIQCKTNFRHALHTFTLQSHNVGLFDPEHGAFELQNVVNTTI